MINDRKEESSTKNWIMVCRCVYTLASGKVIRRVIGSVWSFGNINARIWHLGSVDTLCLCRNEDVSHRAARGNHIALRTETHSQSSTQ